MECELCEKPIEEKQLVVPVGAAVSGDNAGRRLGIHLDCIKEMLVALRGATLALAPKNENEASTGERDGQ